MAIETAQNRPQGLLETVEEAFRGFVRAPAFGQYLDANVGLFISAAAPVPVPPSTGPAVTYDQTNTDVLEVIKSLKTNDYGLPGIDNDMVTQEDINMVQQGVKAADSLLPIEEKECLRLAKLAAADCLRVPKMEFRLDDAIAYWYQKEKRDVYVERANVFRALRYLFEVSVAHVSNVDSSVTSVASDFTQNLKMWTRAITNRLPEKDKKQRFLDILPRFLVEISTPVQHSSPDVEDSRLALGQEVAMCLFYAAYGDFRTHLAIRHQNILGGNDKTLSYHQEDNIKSLMFAAQGVPPSTLTDTQDTLPPAHVALVFALLCALCVYRSIVGDNADKHLPVLGYKENDASNWKDPLLRAVMLLGWSCHEKAPRLGINDTLQKALTTAITGQKASGQGGLLSWFSDRVLLSPCLEPSKRETDLPNRCRDLFLDVMHSHVCPTLYKTCHETWLREDRRDGEVGSHVYQFADFLTLVANVYRKWPDGTLELVEKGFSPDGPHGSQYEVRDLVLSFDFDLSGYMAEMRREDLTVEERKRCHDQYEKMYFACMAALDAHFRLLASLANSDKAAENAYWISGPPRMVNRLMSLNSAVGRIRALLQHFGGQVGVGQQQLPLDDHDIEDSVRVATCGLRFIRRALKYSPTVRSDLFQKYDNIVENLVGLLTCPLADTFKATVLRTMAAVARDTPPLANEIWVLMLQNNLLAGLSDEHHQVEVPSESYPATIVFLRLIYSLLRARTPTCVGPLTAWLPFVRYVATILANLDAKTYRTPSHKWQLAKWSLRILHHIFKNFADCQPEGLLGVEVAAMALDCGGFNVVRTMKLLLAQALGLDSDTQKMSLPSMGTAAGRNWGLQKMRATMEDVVLLILRIFDLALTHQRMLVECADAGSMLSLAAPFEVTLLAPVYKLGDTGKAGNTVVAISDLLSYGPNIEIAHLAVDLLLRLSRSPSVNKKLMPLLRSCQGRLTVAIAQRLGARELEPDPADTQGAQEGEDSEAHQARLRSGLLLRIADLLLANIEHVPYPNIAHMCLGYDISGKPTATDLSKVHTGLHCLVAALLDSHTMGPLWATNPQLSERTLHLLHALSSDPKTSTPTMNYLRSQNFFVRGLEQGLDRSQGPEKVQGTAACGNQSCGRVSDTNVRFKDTILCDRCFRCQMNGCVNAGDYVGGGRVYCRHCVPDPRMVDAMHRHTWLLKLVSMELRRMVAGRSHAREIRQLLNVLLQGTNTMGGDGQIAMGGRQRLLVMLDAVSEQREGLTLEQLWSALMSRVVRVENFDLRHFGVIGEHGEHLFDIVGVVTSLTQAGFELTDMSLRDSHGHELPLERLMQYNCILQHSHAQQRLLAAWCQLLECAMGALPCLPPLEQHEAAGEIAQDLFQRLRVYDNEAFVDNISRALLVVIARLSEIETPHGAARPSGSQAFLGQLNVIILAASKSKSQRTRAQLFGILMKATALMMQGGLPAGATGLDGAGLQLDGFVTVAAQDTREGTEGLRAAAMMGLGSLLMLDRSEAALNAMRSKGDLPYLVSTITQEDARLCACLGPDTDSKPLDLHGAKMSLLLDVARTRSGANALLLAGVTNHLAQARSLVVPPSRDSMDESGPATHRCVQVALWAFRVLGAMVTSLGVQNADVMRQIATFVEAKDDVVGAALSAIPQDGTDATELAWLASGLVYGLCQHSDISPGLQSILTRLHRPMLALLARYGSSVQWETNAGGLRTAKQAHEDRMLHSLCANILAYCCRLTALPGGQTNAVLAPALTPAHVGSNIVLDYLQSVRPPPLGLLANYLHHCLSTLNNACNVVRLNTHPNIVASHKDLALLLYDNLEATLYLLWRHLSYYLSDDVSPSSNQTGRQLESWQMIGPDERRVFRASAVATLAPLLSNCEGSLKPGVAHLAPSVVGVDSSLAATAIRQLRQMLEIARGQ